MKFVAGTTSIILAVIILMPLPIHAQIDFTSHTITDVLGGAISVNVIDMDNDDDIDIVAAGNRNNGIYWFENDGDDDPEFTQHVIDGNYRQPYSVFAIDIDNDEDIDALAAGNAGNSISWWENNGDQDFEEHEIADEGRAARCVYAVDINSDGDIDVIGALYNGHSIVYWENIGNGTFIENTITNEFGGSWTVYAEDIDGDDDLDIIGGALGAGDVTWWENDGANEPDFAEHNIAPEFNGAINVYAADIDSDGDMDVIGAAHSGDNIKWWENDGDQDFNEHIVTNDFVVCRFVRTADFDLDGDIDIVGGAGSTVAWWENDGDEDWDHHNIIDEYGAAICVIPVDIDEDGDIDILSASSALDEITWLENNLNPIGNCSVDGTITDAETGASIEGAVVRFGIHNDISDQNGDYFIEDMYGMTYTVIVEAEGYADYREEGVEVEEGGITFDFELNYPAVMEIDADSLFLHSPEGETSILTRTIGNNGGVDLIWRTAVRYIDNEIIWLSLNEVSGNVAPDEEFELSITGDAEELTEGIYQATISIFSNDPENNFLEIPVQYLVGYEPPDSFNLASPDSGDRYIDTDIMLVWEIATDPDPHDEVVYDIYISADPDYLDDPVAWGLENTFYNFEAPNQIVYWWTVQARDGLNMSTWANQIWSFRVDDPDLPSGFSLLEPAEDTVISLDGNNDILFQWEESIDPDQFDTLTYDLFISAAIGDGTPESINFSRLDTTSQIVNIPNELGIEGSDESLEVEWWVEAISGGNIVQCDQRFTFEIEPFTGITDNLLNEIPESFKIVTTYPNPFNASLTTVIALPRTSDLSITIFNIYSQEVAIIASGQYSPGYKQFTFDASGLSSGIYFVNVNVPEKLNEVRKIVLVK